MCCYCCSQPFRFLVYKQIVPRPAFELAQIVKLFGKQYIEQCKPNSFIVRTLDAVQQCRTATLGGHKEACSDCGSMRISYNSCGNRHCPKCQANKQAIWADDRMSDALDCKYFHLVFTVPEALNDICILNSKQFYTNMFDCVWSTLQSFGYSEYKIDTGAICVLHTWGQNLSLHPHIHCIVPAAGLTFAGNLKRITKGGKYIYPVKSLSTVFRGKLLEKVKHQLIQSHQLSVWHAVLNKLWKEPWVVYCKPSMGNAQQVVQYLGQYTHRIAISNHRINNIVNNDVTFWYKDYKDDSKKKLTSLTGVEFLRRFSMHILPRGFVKIRYYGILSSKQKDIIQPLLIHKKEKVKLESKQQRIVRLTGFDRTKCTCCKTGTMVVVEMLPRIRAPGNVLYNTGKLSF